MVGLQSATGRWRQGKGSDGWGGVGDIAPKPLGSSNPIISCLIISDITNYPKESIIDK